MKDYYFSYHFSRWNGRTHYRPADRKQWLLYVERIRCEIELKLGGTTIQSSFTQDE